MDSEAASAAIVAMVTARLGLAPQKRWSDGIGRLIPELVRLTGAEDLETALQNLRHAPFDTAAWRRITAAVTIGETRFLRQRSWFERIQHTALATLIRQRRLQGLRNLQIWSAGCSTGEEPYTLAVILREMLPDFAEWRIDIVGTDARTDAVEAAVDGVFDMRQLRELGPDLAARYFTPAPRNCLAVTPELRRTILFRTANLIDQAANPHSFERFDLVLCRNVLMYMEPAAQRTVARYLVSTLTEEGWLAVSPAEALADWFKPLAPVNTGEAILFTRRSHAPSRPAADRPTLLQPAAPPVTVKPLPRAEPREDNASILRQARDLADRGHLEEARGRCEAVLSADRLNAEAALLLAEICSDIGDDAAAHAAARIAVYVAPSSPQAHFLLAGALLRLGKPDRATKAMTTARRLAAASDAAPCDSGRE
jgi:chemotaxis protein methyltransferase CheR